MPLYCEDTSLRRASVEQTSRDGNLFRAFFQDSVPADTTYFFTLDIPKGIVVVGFSRFIEVEEGSIRARFGVGTGFGASQASYTSHNFNVISGRESDAVMRRVTDPVGLEYHSPNRLIAAPTTGPIRLPSNQTDAGAQVTLDSNNLPFFTITNLSATEPRDCTLFLVWQERTRATG